MTGQCLGPIGQKGALAALHKGQTPAKSRGLFPQLLEQPATSVASVDTQTLRKSPVGGSVAKG
jgi:hypothetical protein